MAELSKKEWEELHQKTLSQDGDVRWNAARSLGSAFSSIPDEYKPHVWQDLHRLTSDQDSYVRRHAARSLGSAFSSIPDEYKPHAWQDLIKLTSDQNSDVRMHSYHSLGRASIFRATNAATDEAFQENITNAIEFFERSSQEAKYYSPAEFCVPFYRSFLAVTFQEAGSQEHVDRYLAEAKAAAKGSKSKALLLEAVENLSQALLKAQGAKGLQEKQAVLEACRPYCDKAAELLNETDEVAPGASMVVRRGIPIFNRQIKAILKEIEEKAAKFCQAAKDTPLEGFGRSTFEQTRDLAAIENENEAEMALKFLLKNVLDYCSSLPSGVGGLVCRQLMRAQNGRPMEQGMAIASAFTSWTTYAQDMKKNAEDAQKIMARLDGIDFHILKLSQLSSQVATNSSETVDLLKVVKAQLEEIAELGPMLKALQSSPDKLDSSLQKSLEEKDQEISNIVKGLNKILKKMPELATRGDLSLEMKKLEEEFAEPTLWKLADRASTVAFIIELILKGLGMC